MPRDAYGTAEVPAWRGGAASRDFAAPLRPDELGTRSTVFGWLRNSLRPTVEAGARNSFSPLSGQMAGAHVVGRRVVSRLGGEEWDLAGAPLLAAAGAPGVKRRVSGSGGPAAV